MATLNIMWRAGFIEDNRMIMRAISMLIILVSCHAQALPTNEELNIGVTQEFENMNPIISQMLATTYMNALVLRTINILDVDGKSWIPQLVTSIPTLENGGAKLVGKGPQTRIVSHWEIQPKATWGDGTPLTGYDVQFSREIALSPNVSVGEKEVYGQIDRIEVDTSNPKKFTLISKPRFDYNRLGTFRIVPKHLEEKPFRKHGDERDGYGKNSLYAKDPTNRGLYNGPYVISDIKLGDHITFIENPKWWGKKPSIKRINVKLIPISSALESNLRSGTIHMISVLGLSLDEALAFEKRVTAESLPFRVSYIPSLQYEHIDLNLRNPILKDINVRKALVLAINRDDLMKGLFEDKQRKAIHWMAPADVWYTEDPKKVLMYPPSRRQAQRLLDQAGWKKNSDGYRYKDGVKLSLSLMTTAGNKVRELVQVYLQNEWHKIGAEILIRNEPARVLFGETVRKGLYPAMVLFAWVSSPENSPRAQFHSHHIPTKENSYSGQNTGAWSNPEVDRTIDLLEAEFSSEKRRELIGRILKAYTDEVPVIPLYYRSDVAVIPINLKNYRMVGHQSAETNWVEHWTLE